MVRTLLTSDNDTRTVFFKQPGFIACNAIVHFRVTDGDAKKAFEGRMMKRTAPMVQRVVDIWDVLLPTMHWQDW